MSVETTDPTPAPAQDDESALQALYRDLAAVDLQPLWTITEQLLPATPRPQAVPWLWSAATMKPLARRAIQLVPVEHSIGTRPQAGHPEPGEAIALIAAHSLVPATAGILRARSQCDVDAALTHQP